MRKIFFILLFSLCTTLSFGQINLNQLNNTGTLLLGSVTSTTGGNIWYFGDSITNGTGASPSTNRWTTLVATILGLTEQNNGVNGAMASSLSLSTIPTKGSTDRFIFFEYGTNEVGNGVSSSTFNTNLSAIVANTLSKGWAANQIVLVSTFGCSYSKTSSAMIAMNAVASSIATANGCQYLELYNSMLNSEPQIAMSYDGVHPSNEGHYLISRIVEGLLSPLFTIGTQTQISNGLSELTNIKIRNYPFLTQIIPLGIDNNGNVGVSNALKDNLVLNTTYLNKSLIQSGSFLPSSYSTSIDNLLAQGSKLIGTSNNSATNYNYVQLYDGNGNVNFVSMLNISAGYGGFNFFGTGGALKALSINSDNAGNVLVPVKLNLGSSSFMESTNGSYLGRIRLFNGSGGNMEFYVNFTTAGYVWNTLSGTAMTLDYTNKLTVPAINLSAGTASKVVFTDASKNLTSTGIGTGLQGIAGDGSLFNIGSRPHTIFTPTTGGTVTLIANQYNIINPSGALATLTVTLPASPSNNDCVFIKYTQAITTVTYNGGTVVDGITTPSAGGLTVLTFDSGTTSWY